MSRMQEYIALNLILLFLFLVPGIAASVEAPNVTHLHSLSVGLHVPIRIATDAEGNAYVTDTRKHRVCVLDAYGDFLRYIYGVQAPLSVAVDGQDRLYIGDREAGNVGIFTPEGIPLGKLGTGDGQFALPTDIAIDAQNRIYVVDGKENCVKVFDENGGYRFQFGNSILQFPTGIAIDEANDAILVGQYGAIENGKNAAKVQIFNMQGEWRNSFGRYGGKPGEFTRIQGLAVDRKGRIYVTDCFQATVQVVDYSGNGLAFIGHYGTEPGQFRLPYDVAFDPYNRLWATSTNTGRVEVFGIDAYRSPDDQAPENAESSFTINMTAGFNLVSVPLKPSTDWRLSDLAKHIGDDVISIVTYRSEQEGTSCYLPGFPEDDPTNILVKGSDSYIIIMQKDRSVTFQGTAWEGEVAFPSGMSMFAVPLQLDTKWRFSDLAKHVGDKLTHLITRAERFEIYTPGMDSLSNAIVEGGVGYLAVMSEPETVMFAGSAWENEEETVTAAPGVHNMTRSSTAPVLVVQGKVLDPEDRAGALSASQGISIQLKNQSTGVEKTIVTRSNGDYVTTFADFVGNRTASVGDVIRVKVADPQWTTQAMPYELTAEDIRMSHVILPIVQLEVMPKKSVLLHNYPNPANPETWIPYRLSEDADVRIEIYNLSGQLLRTLNLGIKEAGNYVNRQRAAYWDGNNEVGEAVSSGVYFYVIRAAAFGAAGRMVILK